MNHKCVTCKHCYVSITEEGLNCAKLDFCIDNSLFEKDTRELHLKEDIKSKERMTVEQSKYRKNIIEKMDKQIQKGIDKYGSTLEQNDWFKAIDRIVYLQEELIDALIYSEHIIAKLKELNINLD